MIQFRPNYKYQTVINCTYHVCTMNELNPCLPDQNSFLGSEAGSTKSERSVSSLMNTTLLAVTSFNLKGNDKILDIV